MKTKSDDRYNFHFVLFIIWDTYSILAHLRTHTALRTNQLTFGSKLGSVRHSYSHVVMSWNMWKPLLGFALCHQQKGGKPRNLFHSSANFDFYLKKIKKTINYSPNEGGRKSRWDEELPDNTRIPERNALGC